MVNTRGKLVPARIYEVDDRNTEKPGGVKIICMFNPFEYTVTKSNTYAEKEGSNQDVPTFEFKKGGAQTLKLKLVFDTYLLGTDVSLLTNQLWKLMESKTRTEGDRTEKVPPPDVAFEWGVFKFVSVVTNMTQKFTLFSKEGLPVRAEADLTFTQHKDVNDYPAQNPTSGGGPIERIWRVLIGDRLDTIAAKVYGDATKWRLIAARNGIENPKALRPGTELSIPKST